MTGDRIFNKDFTLTFSASFLFWSVTNLLIPLLPLYVLTIGGSDSDMGLIVAAYWSTAMLSRTVAGRCIAWLGPARLMRISAGVLCVSVFAYLLAAAPSSLLIVRLAHGAAMGVYSTSASTLVGYLAPVRRRGETIGIYSTALSLSQAVGPAVGIALLSYASFAGLFVIVWLMATIPLVLTYPVDRAGKHRPEDRRAGRFFSRGALLPAIGAVVGFAAFGPVSSYIPVYSMEKGLANPGLFFTAYAIGGIAVRAVGGRLSDTFGRTQIVIPASALICGSMLWLSVAAGAWSIVGVGVVYGTANGLLYPALMAQAVDRSSWEERGSAMATFLCAMELGISVGAMLASLIVASFPLSVVWLMSAAIAAVGALIYTREWLREKAVGVA
ncbi:MAG: MFS transporter [Chloroflexi bacterium]|nr:MFS transporter [Chloroflexota bacterium]